MLKLTNVSKSYRQGDTIINVLKDISLTIDDGEKVAIVGASGSGKSTLLALMSGMDTPDAGKVEIDGKDLSTLSASAMATLRNEEVAVIFQSFELVPSFSALENVMLPLDIRNISSKKIAEDALDSVGLAHRVTHLPSELSGGEEQRVAIARALAQNPAILFADEPTGNIDHTTGEEVLKLLLGATGEHSQKRRTLIIITHDESIAKRMDRILVLENGMLTSRT